MSEISDYLNSVSQFERKELERICDIVKKVVPEAEEGISYGMPAFRYKSKPLLGFVSAKQHLSIFPFSPDIIESNKDKLDGYSLSKGTIRFTLDNPIPENTLKQIILDRVKEID